MRLACTVLLLCISRASSRPRFINFGSNQIHNNLADSVWFNYQDSAANIPTDDTTKNGNINEESSSIDNSNVDSTFTYNIPDNNQLIEELMLKHRGNEELAEESSSEEKSTNSDIIYRVYEPVETKYGALSDSLIPPSISNNTVLDTGDSSDNDMSIEEAKPTQSLEDVIAEVLDDNVVDTSDSSDNDKSIEEAKPTQSLEDVIAEILDDTVVDTSDSSDNDQSIEEAKPTQSLEDVIAEILDDAVIDTSDSSDNDKSIEEAKPTQSLEDVIAEILDNAVVDTSDSSDNDKSIEEAKPTLSLDEFIAEILDSSSEETDDIPNIDLNENDKLFADTINFINDISSNENLLQEAEPVRSLDGLGINGTQEHDNLCTEAISIHTEDDAIDTSSPILTIDNTSDTTEDNNFTEETWVSPTEKTINLQTEESSKFPFVLYRPGNGNKFEEVQVTAAEMEHYMKLFKSSAEDSTDNVADDTSDGDNAYEEFGGTTPSLIYLMSDIFGTSSEEVRTVSSVHYAPEYYDDIL